MKYIKEYSFSIVFKLLYKIAQGFKLDFTYILTVFQLPTNNKKI